MKLDEAWFDDFLSSVFSETLIYEDIMQVFRALLGTRSFCYPTEKNLTRLRSMLEKVSVRGDIIFRLMITQLEPFVDPPALRNVMCYSAEDALYYAQYADKAPHPQTRAAVHQGYPEDDSIIRYAAHVDRCWVPETAELLFHTKCVSQYANCYRYAKIMHALGIQIPEWFRRTLAQDPYYALYCAEYIDERALPDTTASVLRGGTPEMACTYARRVPGADPDLFRPLASKQPWFAVQYAQEVDKGPHPVTREGASTSRMGREQYEKEFDTNPETTVKPFTSQSGPIITVTCTHEPHTHNTPA